MSDELDALRFREEDHTYWVGIAEVPSLSKVRKYAGFVKDLSAIPKERLERARARGKAVHEAIHHYFYNEEAQPSVWYRYVENAIRYVEENKILPNYIERPNLDHNHFIASTPDLLDVYSTLTDWKTSYEIRPRDLEEFWIQFAGEESALVQNDHLVDAWRIVHLQEEDYKTYEASEEDKSIARERFLAASHKYWWDDPDGLEGNKKLWHAKRQKSLKAAVQSLQSQPPFKLHLVDNPPE